MPCSGFSALHGGNPNQKKNSKTTIVCALPVPHPPPQKEPLKGPPRLELCQLVIYVIYVWNVLILIALLPKIHLF